MPKTKAKPSNTLSPEGSENNMLLLQLIEAWRINNRINLLLLDAIPEAGLSSTLSTRGGRTVALQFAHMHNVRIGWLEHMAKEIFKKYSKFNKNDIPDRRKLKVAFEQSGNAIEELIQLSSKNKFQVKAFKRGIIPWLGYLMTHDAHQRGNILLTLKQTGHQVPDSVKWGMWEWDKL